MLTERYETWGLGDTLVGVRHSVVAGAETGLLYANGTQSGMHVLDLTADPTNPREVGRFTDFYVHDCYRRGDRLYAAAIRNGFLGVLDVARPDAIREISRFSTGGTFTHNAWPTRDGRYLFTTDERAGSPLEGWDLVATPPLKVSQYIAAYIFPGSNLIVVDDINGGLFVVEYTGS